MDAAHPPKPVDKAPALHGSTAKLEVKQTAVPVQETEVACKDITLMLTAAMCQRT